MVIQATTPRSCIGGHDTVTGTNNIQYTAQFGNGVSGTIGLDDPLVFNRTVVFNLATTSAVVVVTLAALNIQRTAPNAYGGVHAPDIVGNIRVDQAWGLFQISAAALHEVNASYNTLTTGASEQLLGNLRPPRDKWGGSVMAALQIKNIPTGAGDDIKIDVSYCKGDIKNVIATSGSGAPSFAMFGDSGHRWRVSEHRLRCDATDAVYLPVAAGGTATLKLTEGFGVRGAFNHNWDPYWSSSLFGSYSVVRYDGSELDLTAPRVSSVQPTLPATPARSP